MSINRQVCIECGHDIGNHFQDVTGVVRCLFRRSGVTSGGVSGLHWEDACDCVDYRSENAQRVSAHKDRCQNEFDAAKKVSDALLDEQALRARAAGTSERTE